MSDNGKKDRQAGTEQRLATRELQRRLAGLSPRRRLEALLDSPQARALVRSLPAEQLYLDVAEVGLADCTELVQLASPSQFRTFVDLGGWKRDQLEHHEVLTWLRAARGDSPEELLRKLRALDAEVVELLLREFLVVHDREENPDVDPEGVTLETPEGRYLLEFKGVEGPELAAMRRLVSDMIADNPFESVRFFEATRWEVPGELEETAFQFRRARLQDMGFPPLEEAVQLFSRVELAPSPGGPGSALALGERVDWLEAALRGLEEEEREGLEVELRYLSNRVLVAEVEDPGNLEAVRRTAEVTRDYLQLGLEHLCGGHPERAAQVVRDTPLERIFKTGFTLTLQLKFRADRLMKEPLAQVEGVPLVLAEEAAALEAVRRKRPRRALRVPGAEPVAFRSRRELAATEALLARAEQQVVALGALLGGTPERAKQRVARFGVNLAMLGVERVFAAAVAMALLEGRVEVRPVPAGRDAELGALLFEGREEPRLRAGAAERVCAVLEPAVPEPVRAELRRMVGVVLARLLEEWGPSYLIQGRLDPALSVVLPMEGAPLE